MKCEGTSSQNVADDFLVGKVKILFLQQKRKKPFQEESAQAETCRVSRTNSLTEKSVGQS